MKVFKFGGASVKDIDAIKNVASIVSKYNSDKVGIIVSAMGKTTNALEDIVNSFSSNDNHLISAKINQLKTFHLAIVSELISDKNNEIYDFIEFTFKSIEQIKHGSNEDNYDFIYDQVVPLGEILSTKIITAYLSLVGIKAKWLDARKLIKTDNKHREAEVNWNETEVLFNDNFLPEFKDFDVLITQGFLGHTENEISTTLGREGSDYSAAIMAYMCNAKSLTIWKDVPGMLNADPKFFDNTIKLDSISFREAIELSYYGASVIHPKTIKPLQNKNIPLFVKSFIDPHLPGTSIQSCTEKDNLIPSFIFKMKQVLFSFTPKDFSFIVERNLSDIFNQLDAVDAKINLMQNSALNFSIVVDQDRINIDNLIGFFSDQYDIKYNLGLELITIRHYDDTTIDRVTKGKQVLLEQKTRETARIVVRTL